MAVYVDDILLAGERVEIENTKKLIKERFKIKGTGKVNFIIGIKFKHKNGYFLNQSRYAEEILEKFGMKNSVPSRNTKPILDEDLRKNKIDKTKYRSAIRNLLYLAISTGYHVFCWKGCKKIKGSQSRRLGKCTENTQIP